MQPDDAGRPAATSWEPAFGLQIDDRPQWLEIAVIFLVAAVADVTIYHGQGYAGIAAFLAATPLLFMLVKLRRSADWRIWIVATALIVACLRLLWCGSVLMTVAGFGCWLAFATALDGRTPFVLLVAATAAQSLVAGGYALLGRMLALRGVVPRASGLALAGFIFPAVAVAAFGLLFVLANPDVVAYLKQLLDRLFETLAEWLRRWELRASEVFFVFAAAWIAAGLLRPILRRPSVLESDADDLPTESPAQAPLYAACRNTLLAVIGLFTVYLAFEFISLWKRDFPEGFYYAGYAHEGAAWLTAALALATGTLSAVFSSGVRRDPRVSQLRRLAWIWSVQNLLLSLSVYNRLFIYVDFNGMTRMRILGLFGISLVVVGFALVVWKILRGKTFTWLLQRQGWAFCAAVYFFAVTPVDALAVSYNVRRVLAGNESACMQIGVQPLDLEGTLSLTPLLAADSTEIREGVAALLADRYVELRRDHEARRRAGWTAYQLSDRRSLHRLQDVRQEWERFLDDDARAAELQAFYEFAYQWY